MLNSRWYKTKYISILIIFYILIFTGSTEDAFSLNIRPDKHIQQTNYILAESHGNYSIDLNQAGRKVWVFQNTNAWIRSFNKRCFVLIPLPVLCILSIFIDKHKKIKELFTMRFNGTKYKGWCLLPKV